MDRSDRRDGAAQRPPSALSGFPSVVAGLADRRPAIFLDYDGTLTPIVDRPDLAVLDGSVREHIARLARCCPVAIVSGRDLDDVARLVGLPDLVFAGSHGFDIRGPGVRAQIGAECLPALDAAEERLRRDLAAVAGVLVERKRFAIAVHTRLVDPAAKPTVSGAVRAAAEADAGLRMTGGKEIHELRPDLPWNKGMAVLSLLERLGLTGPDVLPVYVGDDETDEDAFHALADRGMGVRVMDTPSGTAATWSLADPGEVAEFLGRLASRLECRV